MLRDVAEVSVRSPIPPYSSAIFAPGADLLVGELARAVSRIAFCSSVFSLNGGVATAASRDAHAAWDEPLDLMTDCRAATLIRHPSSSSPGHVKEAEL
jgi:hypothetical protein